MARACSSAACCRAARQGRGAGRRAARSACARWSRRARAGRPAGRRRAGAVLPGVRSRAGRPRSTSAASSGARSTPGPSGCSTTCTALAVAYGWREPDVLALSPRRRRHYLASGRRDERLPDEPGAPRARPSRARPAPRARAVRAPVPWADLQEVQVAEEPPPRGRRPTARAPGAARRILAGSRRAGPGRVPGGGCARAGAPGQAPAVTARRSRAASSARAAGGAGAHRPAVCGRAVPPPSAAAPLAAPRGRRVRAAPAVPRPGHGAQWSRRSTQPRRRPPRPAGTAPPEAGRPARAASPPSARRRPSGPAAAAHRRRRPPPPPGRHSAGARAADGRAARRAGALTRRPPGPRRPPARRAPGRRAARATRRVPARRRGGGAAAEAAPAPPAVHVTIGRVEVRAGSAPASRASAPIRRQAISLDEYLRQRAGGRRMSSARVVVGGHRDAAQPARPGHPRQPPGHGRTTRPPDRARGTNAGNQLNLFLYQTAAQRGLAQPGHARAGEAGRDRVPAAAARPVLPADGLRRDGENDETTRPTRSWAGDEHPARPPDLSPAEIAAALGPGPPTARTSARACGSPFQPLTLDEMSKLWTTFQTQYRISAAYQVSVVLIDSERAARAPLPVLRQGEEDRGPEAVPDLTPPSRRSRRSRPPTRASAPSWAT